MSARLGIKLSYYSVFILLFVAFFLCICQESHAAGRRRGASNLVNAKQGFLNDLGGLGFLLQNGSVGFGFGGFGRRFFNPFFNNAALAAALQTTALSNLQPAIDVGGLGNRIPSNFGGTPNQGGLGPNGAVAGPQPFDQQGTPQRQDIIPINGTSNLGFRQGGDGRIVVFDPATGRLVEGARVSGGGFVINGQIVDSRAREEFFRFSRQGTVGDVQNNVFRRGN